MAEALKSTLEEWISLKTQITEIRKDLSVLNKREKELGANIKVSMKQNEIDDVKIRDSKVRMQVKESKGSLTKDVIQAGLKTYFNGDEVKVEGAMKSIIDSVPRVEKSSLRLLKNGSKQ